VKPWQTIANATAPDGVELVLAKRDDEWVVRTAGRTLMSSRQHASEEALATLALERSSRRRRILIGGLGFGFTLRAVLDRVPVDASVEVVELVPAVVAWNREHLSSLAGRPLDDRRVTLLEGGVKGRIRAARARYDLILLDVDNGPSSVAHADNDSLYGVAGIAYCHGALAEDGVLGVWSAAADPRFVNRLGQNGFAAEAIDVGGRGSGEGGPRHVVFVGVKRPELENLPPMRRGKPKRR
jgi:spermidine synthase